MKRKIMSLATAQREYFASLMTLQSEIARRNLTEAQRQEVRDGTEGKIRKIGGRVRRSTDS